MTPFENEWNSLYCIFQLWVGPRPEWGQSAYGDLSSNDSFFLKFWWSHFRQVRDTNDDVTRSSQLLTGMIRKAFQNRIAGQLAIGIVAFGFVLAIVLSIRNHLWTVPVSAHSARSTLRFMTLLMSTAPCGDSRYDLTWMFWHWSSLDEDWRTSYVIDVTKTIHVFMAFVNNTVIVTDRNLQAVAIFVKYNVILS